MMAKNVKDIMAKMLAEWLFKDFKILIDEPSEREIAETLEEHKMKEMLENGVKKRWDVPSNTCIESIGRIVEYIFI